jgi:TPR repeat protein
MKSNQKAEDENHQASCPEGSSQLALCVRTFFDRDVIIVLMVALAARLLFMLAMPPQARSTDSHSWEYVASILNGGGNPYQTTGMLNWPPFWLQLIFVISKVSTAFSIPFFRVLQIFLILVESAVIVLLIRLIRIIAPAARVRALVIVGIALNPAAILLVCQHCNFDVIVAFWLLLFMLSLLRYNLTKDYADWLCACLFLGLGILTKTVPLILIPLLAGGFRVVTARLRFLGLALLLGPVVLGVSIIYVLAPADVTAKVFAYRSAAGVFGFSGLFHLAGADKITGFYNAIFYILLFTVMAASSFLFWHRQSIGGRQTVLFAALFLMCIPALGPGYNPEYLYWFLPFLIATFAFFKGKWRLVLAGFALIGVCTYLFEFAFFASHGRFLMNILIDKKVDIFQWLPLVLITKMETMTGQTLLRLPLFGAYLIVVATGTKIFLQALKERTAIADRGTIRIVEAGYWFVTSALSILAVGLVMLAKPDSVADLNRLEVHRWLAEAPKGDVSAEYNLGRAYQSGMGVTQDLAQASYWYQRAAERNNAESQNALGMLLAAYRRDYSGAAGWFLRAATNGNAVAQYNLGMFYHEGLAVEQNYEIAAQWFQKSADQGDPRAEEELGSLYASGRGVSQDYLTAYKWLKLAQLQGNGAANRELPECAAMMTPEQIAAAEEQIKQFNVVTGKEKDLPGPP